MEPPPVARFGQKPVQNVPSAHRHVRFLAASKVWQLTALLAGVCAVLSARPPASTKTAKQPNLTEAASAAAVEAGGFDWYTPSGGARTEWKTVTEPPSADDFNERLASDNPPRRRATTRPLEPGNLVFTGVEAFEVNEIRDALALDFDLLIASQVDSGPLGRLSFPPRAVPRLQRAMIDGYRRAGFADVAVETDVDATTEKLVVRVTEGKQFRCGGIEISGTREVPDEALRVALTEKPKRSQVLWTRGEPAPFDEPALSEIRQQIQTVFAEHGFCSPVFNVNALKHAVEKTATLQVSVEDEGPRARVGTITIVGLKRDEEDDLRKVLEIERGMLYDAALPERIESRLWNSGRYAAWVVNGSPKPESETDAAREATSTAAPPHDLRIDLVENPGVPPLATKLAPAQEAVLKFRDWLSRWSAGETNDEVVVIGVIGPDLLFGSIFDMAAKLARLGGNIGEASLHFVVPDEWFGQPPVRSTVTLRLVSAPGAGHVVRARWVGADGRHTADNVLIARENRLVLFNPNRKAKLELTDLDELAPDLDLSPKLLRRGPDERPTYVPRIICQFGFHTRSESDASPFRISTSCSPACALAIVHESECSCLDGIWTIRRNGFMLQFDGATGRLIEFTSPTDSDGSYLTCRTQPGALADELRSLAEPVAAATPQPGPIGKALLAFLLDEVLDSKEAAGSPGALAAIHKVIERWSPPELTGFSGRLNREGVTFTIPSRWACGLTNARRRELVSAREAFSRTLIPPLGYVFPHESWVWRWLCTGTLDSLADADKLNGREFAFRYYFFDEFSVGPVGRLFLTALGDCTRRGHRIDLDDLADALFSDDYQPFLSNESWCGGCFLSLIEALRSLDETELRQLPGLFPESTRGPIARSLLLLKCDPDKPAAEVLPAALDALWEELLQAYAQSALAYVNSTFDAIEAKYKHIDGEVQPASAEQDAK